ncbi:MAG: hypothetical protein IKS20_11790, partial [Victivallales bacterium]|nr:hypothetical protein [Victivallales bacterium]
YYQFWRNSNDEDVRKLLGFFTALPMDEVRRLTEEGCNINRAKEILAYEATALAHGHDVAIKAFMAAGREFGFADPDFKVETTSRIIESKGIDVNEDIPTLELAEAELGEGMGLLTLFVKAGLAASNGEARRLVQGGGCYINDEKVSDIKKVITKDDFVAGPLTLRAGKKNRKRIKLN